MAAAAERSSSSDFVLVEAAAGGDEERSSSVVVDLEENQRDVEEETFRFPDIPHIRIPDRSETSNNTAAWSSSFHARSHSTTPRSRQSSPRSPAAFRDFSAFGGGSGSNQAGSSSSSLPTRFSNSHKSNPNLNSWSGFKVFGFLSKQQKQQQQRGKKKGGRVWYRKKRVRGLVIVIGLVGFFFLMNWWMLSRLQDANLDPKEGFLIGNSSSVRGEWSKFAKGKRPQRVIFARMLALAAHALAEGEGRPEPKDLWEEPLIPASAWTPCSHERSWKPCEGRNGYILVSANGGINQQRVAPIQRYLSGGTFYQLLEA